MGFISSLLGSFTAGNKVSSGGSGETLTCDSCGDDVDEEDMEEGQCEDCRSAEYTGPKYCCGVMYEDGEDTCMSCGEWLGS